MTTVPTPQPAPAAAPHASSAVASVALHTGRTLGEISPLLFGGFAEHMGRCIYEGIYGP